MILTKDVERFHKNHIEFLDGKKVEIDVVVMATGYKVNVGFLCPSICEVKDKVDLYLKVYNILIYFCKKYICILNRKIFHYIITYIYERQFQIYN